MIKHETDENKSNIRQYLNEEIDEYQTTNYKLNCLYQLIFHL